MRNCRILRLKSYQSYRFDQLRCHQNELEVSREEPNLLIFSFYSNPQNATLRNRLSKIPLVADPKNNRINALRIVRQNLIIQLCTLRLRPFLPQKPKYTQQERKSRPQEKSLARKCVVRNSFQYLRQDYTRASWVPSLARCSVYQRRPFVIENEIDWLGRVGTTAC